MMSAVLFSLSITMMLDDVRFVKLKRVVNLCRKIPEDLGANVFYDCSRLVLIPRGLALLETKRWRYIVKAIAIYQI